MRFSASYFFSMIEFNSKRIWPGVDLQFRGFALLAPRTGGNTIHTALKGFGWTGVDEPASFQFVKRCI
jgi:hypothetical protein